MKLLPNLPSDLILLALEDLEMAEQNKKYRVSMERWHFPMEDQPCSVCLAGAVMAMSLDANPAKDYIPCDFDHEGDKLRALNEFRIGEVRSGLRSMGYDVDDNEEIEDVPITHYAVSHTQFKADMRALANTLKENGL